MSMLSNDKVTSIFAEDVVSYVESLDVYSNPSFLIKGRSGLDFSFDIQITGKRANWLLNPSMYCSKMALNVFCFAWET